MFTNEEIAEKSEGMDIEEAMEIVKKKLIVEDGQLFTASDAHLDAKVIQALKVLEGHVKEYSASVWW